MISLRTATLCATLSLTAGCDLLDDLPIGKGYSAKHLCSFIFTSGMDEALVRDTFIAPKVHPLPWIWEITVDYEQQRVHVGDVLSDDPAHLITAIYQEGKGCTLLVDQPLEAVTRIPFRPLPAPKVDPRTPWPEGEGQPITTVEGVDYALLADAIDTAFQEPEDDAVLTTSVLVAYQGQLIAERYAQGASATTRLPGWSMTKTLTGTLAGLLVKDGLLELDTSAPVPGWAESDKQDITLRHLLHMASGLEVNEDYSGFSDVTQMLYKEHDQFAYALRQPVVTPPNEAFHYSTAETNRLAALIQSRVGGTQQAMYEYYQTRLFHPLHIRNGLIEFDASGNLVGGAYGYLTARDWGRIGQLYLQNGRWEGRQLLPEDWVAFATAPSPRSEEYGAHLWLNSNGVRWAEVPFDAYSLVGHQGQRVVVIPSRNLVVVRTGVTESRPRQNQVMATLLEHLLSALPDPTLTHTALSATHTED